MSETNLRASITDAQWAAREAIAALQDGRFKLGAALAALAVRAEAQQDYLTVSQTTEPGVTRSVPLIGSTREERPTRPAAPLFDDLEQTATLRAVPTPPDSTRCKWTQQGVPGSECWGVIYVDQHTGWRHMDPDLDQAHPACPIAPGEAQ